MKAIGGFFPIDVKIKKLPPREISIAQSWYQGKENVSLSSARAAIIAVSKIVNCSKIWIPEIFCGVFANQEKFNVYRLNEDSFDPDLNYLEKNISKNDVVVVVDYFGVEPSQNFIEYSKSKQDVVWVQDASQNLKPTSHWGDFTIFSPRKLLGVLDGGILVRNNTDKKFNLSEIFSNLPVNHKIKIAPIIRKLDKNNLGIREWYKIQKKEEKSISCNIEKSLRLTTWQLERINISKLVESRQENFFYLHSRLESLKIKELKLNQLFSPFGYPIYIPNRDEVQLELAKRGIFAAVHWRSNELKKSHRQMFNERFELTLPCDHRYGKSDMKLIVDTLSQIGIKL